MAHLFPIFVAFIVNCSGIYLFMQPNEFDCLPFFSYAIFLLSVALLLWDISLYPRNYRKLRRVALFIIEFVVSVYLMEVIMNNFWLPLEVTFLSTLQKVPDYLGALSYKIGLRTMILYQYSTFLKERRALEIASYLLSLFFLCCILHATRVVDFRLLRSDGREFKRDCIERSQNFLNAIVSSFKLRREHHCGTNENAACKMRTSSKKWKTAKNYCCEYEDDGEESCCTCDHNNTDYPCQLN